MELNDLFLRGFYWAKSEPIISIGILVAIAIICYFKPKVILKFLALILAIAALLYVLSLFRDVTSTGMSQKETMIEKSKPLLDP